MKVAIMQSYLFPYIGYFQLINSVDVFVADNDVQFIKKGWINRNNIMVNNKPSLFTLSIKKDSYKKNINERYYIMDEKEVEKFRKSIIFSYGKAKYFSDVMSLIDRILEYDDLNVGKFNINSLKEICKYIGIDVKFMEANELETNNLEKPEDVVIGMCKSLNADQYINPIGGMELYRDSVFKKNNIDLFFIQNDVKKYKQFTNEFVPNLSIIDVLMHNSKEEVKELLNQYSLVRNKYDN